MAPSTFVAVAVAVACMVAGASASGLTVQTTSGPVAGVSVGPANHWLGVPFGASTGGANRFMPPKPPAPWTTPFNASMFGPGCLQTGHNADVPKDQSENCLSLNVYAGASVTPDSKLPVMLFFYGGAFVEGGSAGPFGMYNSDYIVGTEPVVVVTANYRLGPFGWIVTDDLTGNQGFKDQLLAMHWVQDNIAAFGGDPARVTLWGESAGAMSGGLHLVSPASKGLFSQLIMESNPSGFRYRNLEDNAKYGNHVCDLLNCTVGSTCNATCMQASPAHDVQSAWDKTGGDFIIIAEANWGHLLDAILMCTPTIDGTFIPQNPMVALAAGNFTHDVPLLFGTNNNEGSTFVYAALNKPLSPILYDLALDVLFGKTKAKEIATRYDYITDPDARTVLSRIITDWWFRCASEQFAIANTKSGTKAFVYVYNHLLSDPELFPEFGLPAVCENRTCHGAELPMVFHMTTIANSQVNFTMTPVEQALSQSFVDYWTSFAIHGDPNVGNTQKVQWPVYTIAGRDNILLQDSITTENATNLCGFWDTIGYDY